MSIPRAVGIPVLALSLLAGCRVDSAGPVPRDIHEQLARVERLRLAGEDTIARPASSRTDAFSRPLVLAGRPQSATLPPTGITDTPASPLYHSLSLSDLPDQAPPAGVHSGHLESDSGERPFANDRPLPSLRQTIKRDLKAAPSDLWRDFKLVYANPVNLAILGSAYAGCLALQETGVDRSIEHHFNTNNDGKPPIHDFSAGWDRAFDAVGNPGTHFAMAGLWYVIGQQTMDDKTYEIGKTLLSALTINGLTVIVGQAATFDKAPNGIYGTFPSGHTSSTFVVASVMHEAYGALVGIPLYGIAGCVAFQRLDDREHYFSDVLMGGVLGLVVGHSVASGRNPEFFGWKVVPWASPQNGAGIAITKNID